MYVAANARSFTDPIKRVLIDRNLPPPIVVGGVGGSGTRLVVHLLQKLGVCMGMHRNASEDAMSFVPVYDKHIDKYLTGTLNAADLVSDVTVALNGHLGPLPNTGLWGWKNPRSIYLLPLIDQMFDGMRFIHVVRDGLAMSTSSNQAQLQKHGTHVIPEEFRTLPQNEQSLIHWSFVNNAAAEYGVTMGMRYGLVRYEDVCEDPVAAAVRLAAVLGVDELTNLSVGLNAIRTRDSGSTMQSGTPASLLTSAALQRFGYPC